jgi:hypothetical protein
MQSFVLTPYGFRVRLRGQDREFFPLNNIFGKDIRDLFDDFFTNHLVVYQTFNEHGSIRVDNYENDNYNRLGIARYGKNGHGSIVSDVNRNTDNYTINPVEATTYPYFFLINFNVQQEDMGIIILQKFGNLGIKSILQESFTQYLRNHVNNELAIQLNNLVPPDLIVQYLRSERMVQIKLIRNTIPRDIANKLGNYGEDEILKGQCELTLKKMDFFTRGNSCNFYQNLERFITARDISIRNIIEVDHFRYDSIKLEFRQENRKKKVIDISYPDSINYYEDISDIELGQDNHPNFNALKLRANEFLEQILELFNDYR